MTQPADRRLLTEAAGNATYAPEPIVGALDFDAARNLSITETGTSPMVIDTHDGYLYGSWSASLYRATDVDGPWELVHNFGSGSQPIRLLPAGDGEMLCSRNVDGMWRSSGWSANPLTATWTKVLDLTGQLQPFGVDTDPVSGWAVAQTYIGGGDMSGSDGMWLSTDRGKPGTWALVYNKTARHPDISPADSHMHVAAIDPWAGPTPRLWVSLHKTSQDPTVNSAPFRVVRYSDDAGASWTTLTDKFQPEAAVATPNGMVFGSDEALMGVYVVHRTADPADMRYELLHAIRVPELLGLPGFAIRGERGADGRGYMTFQSTVAGQAGYVVATDLRRASTVVTLPPLSGTDMVRAPSVVEYKGKLVGHYKHTDPGSGTAFRFLADVPVRGVRPEPNPSVAGVTGGFAANMGVAAGKNARSGKQSVSIGENTATGEDDLTSNYGQAVAIGYNAKASAGTSQQYGVSIGYGTSSGHRGISIGGEVQTVDGVAIGFRASADVEATTFGRDSKSGHRGVALGTLAKATGSTRSVALGHLAESTGEAGIAIGAQSSVSGSHSVAVGRTAVASHAFSVALGFQATTTANSQVALGVRHLEIGKINPGLAVAAPNSARLWVQDNGSGKLQFGVRFPTGSFIPLATEA